uniref:F-box domain-containing protein n=1 Tax=Rhabditophanes sp. KR3021 TaxID=114890 RepID=A0AC35UG26_9BILA
MTSMLPNEQLARTPELFARIITDISEMKDLKNVELTCRAFYELSSQNYKPTIDLYPFASKSLGSKQINGIYFRNGQTKMTFASICVNSNHIKKDLYIRALGKQMKKTTDLVVVGMDSEATEIMLRANCFQNVKKLTLSMMQLNEYSLKIFELSTMNPEILCLDYCQAMFISETENDLSHHVPQSLKHLIIASALISIDPFIKKLLNKFGSKFLELAEFKPEAMHCINSRNELACLSRILSLTKEANIMVSNESLRNFPALKQVLEEEANCSNLTMIIETSVERTFFELLRCESFDQTLKSLKIVSNSENHEYHKLTNIQKTYIYDSIKNLEHLTHITITGFLVSGKFLTL